MAVLTLSCKEGLLFSSLKQERQYLLLEIAVLIKCTKIGKPIFVSKVFKNMTHFALFNSIASVSSSELRCC